METNNNGYYVVSIEDTQKYGITSAAIIGRIRWWCEYNEKNKVKDRFHIEHWWSGFMSSKGLSEQLGISQKTIETHLSKLLKNGVLIKGVFNKKNYDRTSWYRVNPNPQIKEMHLLKSSNSISSNQVNGYTQIKEMDILESGKPIPVNLTVSQDEKQYVNPPVNPPVNPLLDPLPLKNTIQALNEKKTIPDKARSAVIQLISTGAITRGQKETILNHIDQFKSFKVLAKILDFQ